MSRLIFANFVLRSIFACFGHIPTCFFKQLQNLQKHFLFFFVYYTLAKTIKSSFSVPRRFCLQKRVIAKKRCAEKSPERGIWNNLSPQEFVPEYVFAHNCKFVEMAPKIPPKKSTVTFLMIVIQK